MKKPDIVVISDFEQEFRDTLPGTYRLLKAANLKIHPNVRKITLHGSQGPAGGFRDDSDIDLCLVTDVDDKTIPRDELGGLLKSVIQITLAGSYCIVELDLAAVFDHNGCGLECFDVGGYDELRCGKEATGCMGIYKIQKGFAGFALPITQVSRTYPFLTIWKR